MGGTHEQGVPSPFLFWLQEGKGGCSLLVVYCFFVTLACFVWGPRYVGYFCDGMGVCCLLDGSAFFGAVGGCCIRAVLCVELSLIVFRRRCFTFCSCRSRVPITAGRAWQTTE